MVKTSIAAIQVDALEDFHVAGFNPLHSRATARMAVHFDDGTVSSDLQTVRLTLTFIYGEMTTLDETLGQLRRHVEEAAVPLGALEPEAFARELAEKADGAKLDFLPPPRA